MPWLGNSSQKIITNLTQLGSSTPKNVLTSFFFSEAGGCRTPPPPVILEGCAPPDPVVSLIKQVRSGGAQPPLESRRGGRGRQSPASALKKSKKRMLEPSRTFYLLLSTSQGVFFSIEKSSGMLPVLFEKNMCWGHVPKVTPN